MARARAPPALRQFRVELEAPQSIAPHLLEHLADRPQRLASSAIETLATFGALIHEPSFGEGAQLE